MFQNLFAIADVDLAINHAVNAQLRLRNPLFVFAIFCFDVILDGVAVKAIRQGDVNAKMFKKDETEFFCPARSSWRDAGAAFDNVIP